MSTCHNESFMSLQTCSGIKKPVTDLARLEQLQKYCTLHIPQDVTSVNADGLTQRKMALLIRKGCEHVRYYLYFVCAE